MLINHLYGAMLLGDDHYNCDEVRLLEKLSHLSEARFRKWCRLGSRWDLLAWVLQFFRLVSKTFEVLMRAAISSCL